MKLRQSFVSNSSSSSFIIGLKRRPKTEEELKESMFPEDSNDERIRPYDDRYLKISEVVHFVFLDLSVKSMSFDNKYKAKELRNTEKIIEEIANGWYEGHPDMFPSLAECRVSEDEYRVKTGKDLWDGSADDEVKTKYKERYRIEMNKILAESERKNLRCAKELWNREKRKFKGLKIFVVSYSDNDGGTWSIMEHGDIFRNIPHITISHH